MAQQATIDQLPEQNYLVYEILVHVSYSRQSQKSIIYFKENCDFNDIPCNETKYSYYNDLLSETFEDIKLNIKNQSALYSLSYRLMKLIYPHNKKDVYNTTI